MDDLPRESRQKVASWEKESEGKGGSKNKSAQDDDLNVSCKRHHVVIPPDTGVVTKPVH